MWLSLKEISVKIYNLKMWHIEIHHPKYGKRMLKVYYGDLQRLKMCFPSRHTAHLKAVVNFYIKYVLTYLPLQLPVFNSMTENGTSGVGDSHHNEFQVFLCETANRECKDTMCVFVHLPKINGGSNNIILIVIGWFHFQEQFKIYRGG